jgi:hypothetical protein
VLVDVHAEQRGHEKGVSETADREKFSDALQHAQKDQERKAHARILALDEHRAGVPPRRPKRTDYAGAVWMRQAFGDF